MAGRGSLSPYAPAFPAAQASTRAGRDPDTPESARPLPARVIVPAGPQEREEVDPSPFSRVWRRRWNWA
jgi:hypothetical protein